MTWNRLDNDILWIPGDSTVTGYCHVTGKVVLCLNQPLRVKDMKLHFEGRRYMKYEYSSLGRDPTLTAYLN